MNRHFARSSSVAFLLGSLLACTHVREAEIPPPPPCPAPEGCVTFSVFNPTDRKPVANAPVFLISGSQLQPAGTTDSDGLFLAPKNLLTSPPGSALLFCWDTQNLACTAVRLDSRRVLTYNWLNIDLPTNRIIPRSQAFPTDSPTPVPR
jgi:hypothetical protein